jgi:hypothetical protein
LGEVSTNHTTEEKEMNQEYVFVKYKGNWSGEMDLETIWVCPKVRWEAWKKDVKTRLKKHFATGVDDVLLYFGTNEEVSVCDYRAGVASHCKVADINREDAQTLIDWLTPCGVKITDEIEYGPTISFFSLLLAVLEDEEEDAKNTEV